MRPRIAHLLDTYAAQRGVPSSALIEMIDYLVRDHGLTREQAYILCSVATDLVIGQVVDVPNYLVSAIIDLEVFETD